MIDKEYIKARNNLIPIAEKFTNDKIGTSQGPGESREDWARNWSLTFHDKMDELAREQGLVK